MMNCDAVNDGGKASTGQTRCGVAELGATRGSRTGNERTLRGMSPFLYSSAYNSRSPSVDRLFRRFPEDDDDDDDDDDGRWAEPLLDD